MYLGFVFKITNTSNGKEYIGKTLDIDSRIRYLFSAKGGSHLSKAIQEEGKEHFKVEIIHTVTEHSNQKLDIIKFKLQDLWEREVRKHKCYHPKGYNRRIRNDNPDIDLDQVDRTKIEDRSDRGVCNRKPVAMFEESGTLLNQWNSLSEAGDGTGISISSISLCCNGYKPRCVLKLPDGCFKYVIFKYLENCN